MTKSKKNKKNTSVRNARGDKEPKWFFGVGGTILSIIFFPVFFIAFIIYMAQWMCYNLDLPMPVCYVLALIDLAGPKNDYKRNYVYTYIYNNA